VFVPPSVVALGTYSSAQRNSELWFAPAGFTRGGLTEGSAGVPVIQTRTRLSSKERDDLYEANINPIATFPAEGIVIFGQKTLQVTPSALDRINVRRLMIFLKREISRIAATTLFDQNVQATWNRFTGRAESLLRSVQSRLGLTDFKIVLDSSTTTPELVDRNILYAKIFLKPARAIEYIAIDFVITNSGAGFED
jgi:phage tail sheath protein FI